MVGQLVEALGRPQDPEAAHGSSIRANRCTRCVATCYPRTANAQLIALVRSRLLDLSHEAVTTFRLDDANEAVAHAAAHGGPFTRTVITPQDRDAPRGAGLPRDTTP